LAFEVLSELAEDSVWFVRLRAVVSLGKLADVRTIPVLLKGLTDANRLVRLRAAEGLVALDADMAGNFRRVVEVRDRYGLHAYLAAVENANLRGKLEAALEASTEMAADEKHLLQEVLQTGVLPANYPSPIVPLPA
jgi:HEAT repeat protein